MNVESRSSASSRPAGGEETETEATILHLRSELRTEVRRRTKRG